MEPTATLAAEQSTDDLPIYPVWREVLKRFPSYGYSWGDIIPHAWFYEQFGLPMPTDDMPYGKVQKIELKILSMREAFRNGLRSDYRMDLVSVQGLGYEIVTPSEQSRRAMEDFVSIQRREITKLLARLRYVNIVALSDDERRENANLLARAGTLAQMLRREAPLLPDDLGE